jgi:hypothetical protein
LHSYLEKAEARMSNFEEKMNDYHNKRMAMLDTHNKIIMVSFGQTEANTEKTVPDPEMMQSAEEHQEIPTEDAAIMPVGESRKQHRDRKLAAERRQKIKDRDPRKSWI